MRKKLFLLIVFLLSFALINSKYVFSLEDVQKTIAITLAWENNENNNTTDTTAGETHSSLKISDNSKNIISGDRYKNIISESLLIKADSVLTTSSDYICITMGANVGTIILKVNDSSVGSDNIFIYTLVNEESNMTIDLSVKQGRETKVINLPIGKYKLILNSGWSWRYSDEYSATIKSGNDSFTTSSSKSIDFSIVGGKTYDIDMKYNAINKDVVSKSIFTKIPLNYSLSMSEDS